MKNKQMQHPTEMSRYDMDVFTDGKRRYANGDFATSLSIIEKLSEKYIYATPSDPIIQLYFCMKTACNALNKTNKYDHKIHEFVSMIDTVITNNDLKTHLKKEYGLLLLENQTGPLSDIRHYAKYLNTVVATGGNFNIHYNNMDYFKKDDRNKKLLIYGSGGFGDKIMFCRFIRRVCETNQANNNSVIFLVDDNLYWIYSHIYRDLKNIQVIRLSQRNITPITDYHINITMLMYYLGLTYDTLYMDYYLTDLPESQICLDKIIDPNKKNLVINWHGNYQNSDEKHKRGMHLRNMIPLFESEESANINWISVQPEVSPEEIDILKRYNVINLHNVVDKNGDSFKDTLTILKKVDLVITTDTALAHLAATANVGCWIMLSSGCEWRWKWKTKNNDANLWYPKMKMIRQNSIGQWGPVINEVIGGLINVR